MREKDKQVGNVRLAVLMLITAWCVTLMYISLPAKLLLNRKILKRPANPWQISWGVIRRRPSAEAQDSQSTYRPL